MDDERKADPGPGQGQPARRIPSLCVRCELASKQQIYDRCLIDTVVLTGSRCGFRCDHKQLHRSKLSGRECCYFWLGVATYEFKLAQELVKGCQTKTMLAEHIVHRCVGTDHHAGLLALKP